MAGARSASFSKTNKNTNIINYLHFYGNHLIKNIFFINFRKFRGIRRTEINALFSKNIVISRLINVFQNKSKNF